MTYREMMVENRENLGWCKPVSYFGGRVIVAINEGCAVGIQLNGENVPVNPDQLRKIAAMIKPDCNADALSRNFETAVNTCGRELPCYMCPWFDSCDAMDDLRG